jgi:hypothetical protein
VERIRLLTEQPPLGPPPRFDVRDHERRPEKHTDRRVDPVVEIVVARRSRAAPIIAPVKSTNANSDASANSSGEGGGGMSMVV